MRPARAIPIVTIGANLALSAMRTAQLTETTMSRRIDASFSIWEVHWIIPGMSTIMGGTYRAAFRPKSREVRSVVTGTRAAAIAALTVIPATEYAPKM